MSQPIVTMYTTAVCPYCVAAKNYLKNKGVACEEIRVDTDPAQRQNMMDRANARQCRNCLLAIPISVVLTIWLRWIVRAN